ncbi:MAG: hypothetical protein AB7G76_08700 [Steroidobacteraceae bacterium]
MRARVHAGRSARNDRLACRQRRSQGAIASGLARPHDFNPYNASAIAGRSQRLWLFAIRYSLIAACRSLIAALRDARGFPRASRRALLHSARPRAASQRSRP